MMCVDRKGCPDGLQAVAKKGFTERGQSKTWQSGNFTVSVWQDSKPVVVAASNSDPLAKMSVTRKQKDGARINIAAPMSVVQYNKYNYGGVDQNDQLQGYYHVRLKSKKYYKYIFWFMFEVAITNALILCTNHTDLGIKDSK